jgi:hypothetical protein
MAISIQLLRQSTIEVPEISSYKLVVSTVNAQNMSDKIFVKQRIRNFARDRFDDVFVAVCTPTQLEDFEEDAPGEGTSYFRTNTIELVARTAEEIQTVFDSLVYETKKLVVDLTDLENLEQARIFNISAIDPVEELSPEPVITNVVRNASEGLIVVGFTAEETELALPALSYQYSLDGGLSWKDALPRDTSSPLTIVDPSPLTTHNLKIRSLLGKGKYGVPSAGTFVLPIASSTAPTDLQVTPGNQQLSVAFTPPENTEVINYEYSVNNGAVWTTRTPQSNSSPLVITGLTNGTAYNIKLRGINTLGCGVSSAAATGTPVAPAATFWQSCSAGGGIVQIDDLQLLANNWKQDSTGTASGWTIVKNNKAVALSTLSGTGTLRLRCCYKNKNLGSHSADGKEYPSIQVSQLSAAIGPAGYFRMTWNGKQLFNLTAQNTVSNTFSYYPASSVSGGGYGNAGTLDLNQTGLIDVLIEGSNLTSGALGFNFFYD